MLLVSVPKRVIGKLLARLVRVQRILFFEGHTTGLPAVASAMVGEIRLFVAQPEDLRRFSPQLQAELQVPAALVERRVARGNVLLLATDQDRVVSMLWLGFCDQDVSEVGAVLKPRPGEFVTFHAYTVPGYRGRGLSTALNRLACAYAASQGAVRQLAWRRSSNQPALRVAEKLGQRCVATATAVWLLGHRVYFAMDWMVDPVMDLIA
jgi:RimJ/RimL family protein N-acetyltransferase